MRVLHRRAILRGVTRGDIGRTACVQVILIRRPDMGTGDKGHRRQWSRRTGQPSADQVVIHRDRPIQRDVAAVGDGVVKTDLIAPHL